VLVLVMLQDCCALSPVSMSAGLLRLVSSKCCAGDGAYRSMEGVHCMWGDDVKHSHEQFKAEAKRE
jgi:hypothetical protein